jgi:plastocyanin
MRRLAIALPVALLLAAPAHAADQTVRATPQSTFTPNSLTINVGDTVTWVNDGGQHNVKFDDGFEEPAEPAFTWSTNPKRTFTAPGSYRYVCEAHAGSGMIGRVQVVDPNAPPTTGGGPDTTAPKLTSLKLVPSRFCNRKTSKCKVRGTKIRFNLDEDAKISGRIVNRKTGKRAGTISITATAGPNEFDYSGKGLPLGSYRMELTPRDAAGNKASSPTRASFRVATSR